MAKNFDPIEYTKQVGQELVAQFEIAGLGTTPGLVGSAREFPVRDKLRQLLPRGMDIGSGCVIDSFGNTSRQMDVVLYERDICPVYSVNQDPASTYYPCEGVIAVGEIKSTINSDELKDIFRKIASVKELRRFTGKPSGSSVLNKDAYATFRRYGSLLTGIGSKAEEYNQDTNPYDQIHGFAMSGKLGISTETLCKRFIEIAVDTGYGVSPNLVVVLDGNVLCPLSIPPNRHMPNITVSLDEANAVYCVKHPNGSFPFLVARLQVMHSSGRTVSASAFDRYLAAGGISNLPGNGTTLWLPRT